MSLKIYELGPGERDGYQKIQSCRTARMGANQSMNQLSTISKVAFT